MRKILNMIFDKSEMNEILQKVCRSFLNAQNILFSDIYPTRRFSNKIFGLSHISRFLEKRVHPCIRENTIEFRKKSGIVFACFLCVKFNLDSLVFVTKARHIHKITGRSLHSCKVLLAPSIKYFSLPF